MNYRYSAIIGSEEFLTNSLTSMAIMLMDGINPNMCHKGGTLYNQENSKEYGIEYDNASNRILFRDTETQIAISYDMSKYGSIAGNRWEVGKRPEALNILLRQMMERDDELLWLEYMQIYKALERYFE